VRVEQVAINFINNAIKYAPGSTGIEVAIILQEEKLE